jgi:hypothetical protein
VAAGGGGRGGSGKAVRKRCAGQSSNLGGLRVPKGATRAAGRRRARVEARAPGGGGNGGGGARGGARRGSNRLLYAARGVRG